MKHLTEIFEKNYLIPITCNRPDDPARGRIARRSFTDSLCAAVYEQFGYYPIFAAETGSTAWGTDDENSDVDLTIVGEDARYDIFTWPRDCESGKLQFHGHEIDVRIFSIAKFLRLASQSTLISIEAVRSRWAYFPTYEHDIKKLVQHYYDKRTVLKASVGMLTQALQQKGPLDSKTRRRVLHYGHIALQITDRSMDDMHAQSPYAGMSGQRLPVMHVPSYLNTPEYRYLGNYGHVEKLHKWTYSDDPDTSFVQTVRDSLFAQIDEMPIEDGRWPTNPEKANELFVRLTAYAQAGIEKIRERNDLDD